MVFDYDPWVVPGGSNLRTDQKIIGIEFDFAEEPVIALLFEPQYGRPAKARAPITREAVKQLAAQLPEIVEELNSA